jgi:hypothetical protein
MNLIAVKLYSVEDSMQNILLSRNQERGSNILMVAEQYRLFGRALPLNLFSPKTFSRAQIIGMGEAGKSSYSHR